MESLCRRRFGPQSRWVSKATLVYGQDARRRRRLEWPRPFGLPGGGRPRHQPDLPVSLWPRCTPKKAALMAPALPVSRGRTSAASAGLARIAMAKMHAEEGGSNAPGPFGFPGGGRPRRQPDLPVSLGPRCTPKKAALMAPALRASRGRTSAALAGLARIAKMHAEEGGSNGPDPSGFPGADVRGISRTCPYRRYSLRRLPEGPSGTRRNRAVPYERETL